MYTPQDLIGIGIGPFNLGLAALAARLPTLSARMFERKPDFSWHAGLLLEGTTLQVPFLADLVSMADPTHPLSYLNYLHTHDRLYPFYFYEHFLIPRREYDHYCRWAAGRLASCHFGEEVISLRVDPEADAPFVVETRILAQGRTSEYRTRHVAVGLGTAPHQPDWMQGLPAERCFHSADFGLRREEARRAKHVTVVGSGQSAAECVLTLLQENTDPTRRMDWITQSDGYFPMEYSKLGLEYFTPDFMAYFRALPNEKRRALVASQGLLYKGISFSTIAAIFDLLYERSIGGAQTGLRLLPSCRVEHLEQAGTGMVLHARHKHEGEVIHIATDCVIAATGYRHQWPAWFHALKTEHLAQDEQGDIILDEESALKTRKPLAGQIFLQNAEIRHHGVGSPDLGLGAYRNMRILNRITGQTAFRLPARSAFQSFGLAAGHDGFGTIPQKPLSGEPHHAI